MQRKIYYRLGIILVLSLGLLIFKSKKGRCCSQPRTEGFVNDSCSLNYRQNMESGYLHPVFPDDGYLIKI